MNIKEKSPLSIFGLLPMLVKLTLSLILAVGVAHTANAQVLDAIRGHAQDLKARFSDHKKIDGEVLKKGEIDTKAKGQDMLHSSSGTWSLIKSGGQLYLQSSEDFRSSPGPDYHVYISSGPAIKDNPNGAAYYPLTTKNVDDVVSVLIWCKQFKEYIGSADFGLVQN